MLMFGRYVKVGESMYTRITTILKHIDNKTILLKYENSCMINWPKWYKKQKITSNIYTQ